MNFEDNGPGVFGRANSRSLSNEGIAIEYYELPEGIEKRITDAASELGLASPAEFIERAVRNELARLESTKGVRLRSDPTIGDQLDRLEAGQRTTIALLDAAARTIVCLLRRTRAGR